MTGRSEGNGHETAADEAAVRAWFDDHGWQLDPGELRAALQERGADDEQVILLLDEGADRRRAAAAKPANGTRPQQQQREPELVPPQHLEAEEHVLGAMLTSAAAVGMVLDTGLGDRDFYRLGHGLIYHAIRGLADRGEGVDAITVADELDRTGKLAEAGGRVRLHELAAIVPATANAGHWARVIRDTAAVRATIAAGQRISELGYRRDGEASELVEQARQLVEQLQQVARIREPIRITSASQFLAGATTKVDVLLGAGKDRVLPAHGFCLVYGKGGQGKTTLTLTCAAALASATPWLGIPVPRPVRVLLLENEGPKEPYKEKVEEFADQWAGPEFLPNIAIYEEPWGKFSLADRGMRDDLLSFCRTENIDLVAAGPLRGLGIEGPGAPSETDAFLGLLKDAGLGTEIAWWIVHHTNKQNQISGDWDRQPDLLLRLTYEGKRRNRLQFEKIRWGDQGREPLVLEWLDEGVGYRILETTQPDVDWLALEQRCLDAITANPGSSQRKVEELAGAKVTHVRQALMRLEQAGRITDRGGGHRKAFHAAADAPLTLDDSFAATPDELEWGDA